MLAMLVVVAQMLPLSVSIVEDAWGTSRSWLQRGRANWRRQRRRSLCSMLSRSCQCRLIEKQAKYLFIVLSLLLFTCS
jgi:hypothetical protein